MGNRFVLTHKRLTDKEIMELAEFTNLDAENIKEKYKSFLKDYPSGKMNKEQFVELYYQISRNFALSGEMTSEKVFAEFDKNKDGVLDFKEFLLAVISFQPSTFEAYVGFFFNWYDISGDGHLDFQEVVEFFESSKYLSGKNCDKETAEQLALQTFGILGLTDEARVSKEQLIKGCKENHSLRKSFSS